MSVSEFTQKSSTSISLGDSHRTSSNRPGREESVLPRDILEKF